MVEFSPMYSLGDRIVHRQHGVGQIDVIECKPLNGVEVECFKVKNETAIYWFPTDSDANHRLHPVASQDLIQKVIEELQSAAHGSENDHYQWKERIDDVQTDGDLLAISGLVRDLAAMKRKKKLNRFEDQALNNLEDRLLREWGASLEVDAKSIRPKLRACLQADNTDSKKAA